jgi:hypothetical protein
MIVRDHGESGGRWYLVAVHYPSAMMARTAWERAERKLDMSAGDEGIGLIRLAPNPEASRLRTGAPQGVQPIVAMTLDEPTAAKAERLLRDGTPWEPESEFLDALILRRLRILAEHRGETGRLIIRRPEGRGATLDREGELHEHEPGHG